MAKPETRSENLAGNSYLRSAFAGLPRDSERHGNGVLNRTTCSFSCSLRLELTIRTIDDSSSRSPLSESSIHLNNSSCESFEISRAATTLLRIAICHWLFDSAFPIVTTFSISVNIEARHKLNGVTFSLTYPSETVFLGSPDPGGSFLVGFSVERLGFGTSGRSTQCLNFQRSFCVPAAGAGGGA